MKQERVLTLQKGRVFLLGDAAHVMPPFGGQGVNSGARDAANIAWKLAAVLDGKMAQPALASYEAERRDHVQAIVRYSVNVGRLANIRSHVLAAVRDLSFLAANLLPSVRKYFREMRHMPRPYLKTGVVVHADAPGGQIVGRPLPRFQVRLQDGQTVPVDEQTGEGFALIGVSLPHKSLVAAASHPLWRDLGARPVSMSETPGASDGSCSPADETAAAFARNFAGKIIVVRPDKYVAGFAGPDTAFEQLSRQLSAAMGQTATQTK